MSDFGKRLIDRLTAAANRNQTILDNNQAALDDNEAAAHKLTDIVLPVLEKQGDKIALAALREVYSLLEADAEERHSTIEELKETKDLLERSADLLKKSVAMLEQAGFDFSNIRQFSHDKIWLGDHLPTIKRALEIFNTQPAAIGDLSLFDQALDSLKNERFVEIAHAVKRSGDKRQAAAETDALGEPPIRKQPGAGDDVAAAALAAIDAIKVATDLIADQPSGPTLPAEGTEKIIEND